MEDDQDNKNSIISDINKDLDNKLTKVINDENSNIINSEQGKNKFFNKINFIQFVKFSAFSLSAGLIQILSFELMYDIIGWKQWWATYLISIILSVIWNFTFNRKFTFKSASNIPVAMSFAMLFYVFFIPISVFGGQALESVGWNGTVVTILMMMINFVLEYMWDKFLVFNDKIMNKIIRKRKTI